jgi:DNA sulfur modification protein DndB
MAQLVRLVVLRSAIFKDLVEMERTSLSARSRKLFTLSAIYSATSALLEGLKFDSQEAAAESAQRFWEEVAKHVPEWHMVRERKITSGEVRRDYIHSHGIALQALGHAGNALFVSKTPDWEKRISNLKAIDWSRSNVSLWEGRAMIGGRLSKATQNVVLTTAAIKRTLKIPLNSEEERAEKILMSSRGKAA